MLPCCSRCCRPAFCVPPNLVVVVTSDPYSRVSSLVVKLPITQTLLQLRLVVCEVVCHLPRRVMAKSELKLLSCWFSPYALRPQIALNIKGLEYEIVEENLDSKSNLLLQSNPVYKKVPVLLHDGKPVCESVTIVQYIDEVWSNGPSILPEDAYDRANAQFWASYIDDKWFMSLRNVQVAGEDEEAKKPHFEQIEEVLVRLEEVFNKCSDGKGYFGGDNIGLIDIAFGSLLGMLRVIEEMNGRKVLVEAKAPGLVNWAARFAANPAVKGVLPETDKLMGVCQN